MSVVDALQIESYITRGNYERGCFIHGPSMIHDGTIISNVQLVMVSIPSEYMSLIV